jgi:Mn2+/Fe2+ NRAMP family transporter
VPELAKLTVSRVARAAAVWGPGLLAMLADTDAGNVITAAQAGAQWRYRLLPLLLVLIPLLYMVQELTVRVGIHTGRGYGELVRERFGTAWAAVAAAGLAGASMGTLITEFTAVAGIGELFGVSRALTLPLVTVALLAVTGTGSYRRFERIALTIGAFELAFFAMAIAAHPSVAEMARQATDWPLTDPGFWWITAAIIGAAFNPWMIFYQQSATVEKRVRTKDFAGARCDTAIGALMTQLLTGAVLVSAAAAFDAEEHGIKLKNVGQISDALTPLLGATIGRVVFSAGVLGAALVAAIVCSRAAAWGAGEAAGYQRSLERRPFQAWWFCVVYVACIGGAAVLVWLVSDLVWLVVAAQVLNVFLMPYLFALLAVLAATVVPEHARLRGAYLGAVVTVTAAAFALGLYGGIAGLF